MPLGISILIIIIVLLVAFNINLPSYGVMGALDMRQWR